MKENKTSIVVVLDKSGSMDSCKQDTIGGFNSYIKEQSDVEGQEADLTLIQFSNTCDVTFNDLVIQDVAGLDDRNYMPGGGTALYDAIGMGIELMDEKLSGSEEDEKPAKTLIVIITDGGENASRKFNQAKIDSLINERKKDDWEFVFIGANQDAIKSGGDIGVCRAASLTYDQTRKGTRDAYMSLSSSTRSFRKAKRCSPSGEKIGFAFGESDRDKQDVD